MRRQADACTTTTGRLVSAVLCCAVQDALQRRHAKAPLRWNDFSLSQRVVGDRRGGGRVDRVRDYRDDNGQIKNGDDCNEAIVPINISFLEFVFCFFFAHGGCLHHLQSFWLNIWEHSQYKMQWFDKNRRDQHRWGPLYSIWLGMSVDLKNIDIQYHAADISRHHRGKCKLPLQTLYRVLFLTGTVVLPWIGMLENI